MIEEQAIVIAVSGDYARVRAWRQSACGRCAASGACGTSLLERFFGRRPSELTVLNQARAAVGDQVVIGIREEGLLKAAAVAYLLPVAALIVGAAAGEALGGARAEALSVLGAGAGLALALLWLRGYSAWSAHNPGRRPLVLRRLAPSPIDLSVPDPATKVDRPT